MSNENYPEQSILFARIEGREKDGSPILGRPRVIGSIAPLEGKEREAGVMKCDVTPMEKGVFFVIRTDERKGNEPERER